jgi:type I restriction enzyme S subunit
VSKLDTNAILPASWNFVPLEELGDWSGGGTPSKTKPQYWQGGTIPWVSPKDMKTERISDSEDHITKDAVSHSTASLINAGSVLIVTRSGILRHTLPVAVNSVPVTVNQDLKALTPQNGIMAEYVAWALRAFSHDILHTCSKQGTTVNSVETSKLLSFEIPVAPAEQQHRIVAEIEKQFSRLDEAVANLKRVKANLKRYKASVLKAAVEGKLTEDWRKQHPNIEPASKLLERILPERRANWSGKGNYTDLGAPKTDNLPPLPKRWTWATLEMIGQHGRPIIYGIIKPGPHIPDGVPYVRVTEMKNGWIDVKNLRRTSPARAAKFARATLASGDILISKDGTIGRVAVVPPELQGGNITQHVMRAPIHSMMSRNFVVWAIRSDVCQRWLTGETRGVALQGVNVEDFRRLPVPIPSLEEQEQIVAEVDRRLSVIEELEAAVLANLTRADRLRQSILSQAFSGKLVKPNPARMMKGY